MSDHDHEHAHGGACCASCAAGGECESGCVGGGLSPQTGPSPVRSCCIGCASGLDCETGCPGQSPPNVGDLGEDILRGIAKADQALGQVWEGVKDVVPYGEQIDKLHDARMDALQKHAPDYYPPPTPAGSPGAPPPTPPAAARPGSLIQNVLAAERRGKGISQLSAVQRVQQAALPDLAIHAKVMEIRQQVIRAKTGDAEARRRFAELKDRAHAGDLQARREWKAALILAEEPLPRLSSKTSKTPAKIPSKGPA